MLQEITVEFIFHFMLVFARLGTAFGNFPGIGSSYLFGRGKLLVALTATLILLPNISPYLPQFSNNFAANIGYLAIEILIGIIISIAARIYFESLNFIGQIISLQSGLGSASFFDPQQKSQVTLFSNFILLIVIVSIFASNIHHLFIQAVIDSYVKFPPGNLVDLGDLSKFITYVVNDSFILSFKLSSPFLVVSLAILAGSGLLARIMPNLQVFFVVTPAQILVMFGTIYIAINVITGKLVEAIALSTNIQGF